MNESSTELFGRTEDLLHLTSRIPYKGITFLIGPPLIGKSSLLTALLGYCEQRSSSTFHSTVLGLEHPESILVGMASCVRGAGSPFFRATIDLLTRWTASSAFTEQWRSLLKGVAKDFPAGAARALVNSIEKFLKAGGLAHPAPAILLETCLSELLRIHDASKAVVEQISQIDPKAIRLLIDPLCKLAHSRSAVLMIDQWENSDITSDISVLSTILREEADWPPFHIFIAVPDSPSITRVIDSLHARFPHFVEAWTCPPLKFDSAESIRLIEYIRRNVACTDHFSTEQLLAMVDGFPGVLYRWFSANRTRTIRTPEDLVRLREEAFAYRYDDLQNIFEALNERQRMIVNTLSTCPILTDYFGWEHLGTILLDDVSTDELDALRKKELLVTTIPPNLGHPTRAAAIHKGIGAYCDKYFIAEKKKNLSRLAVNLARTIRFLDASESYSFRALAELCLSGERFGNALDRIDSSHFLLGYFALVVLKNGQNRFPTDQAFPFDAVCPLGCEVLYSVGLCNLLDEVGKSDTAIPSTVRVAVCDQLIEAARNVFNRLPGDSQVHLWFGKSLHNAINTHSQFGDDSGVDVLFSELSTMADRDPTLSEYLAKSANDIHYDLVDRGSISRRTGTLRGQLRGLLYMDKLKKLVARSGDCLPAVRAYAMTLQRHIVQLTTPFGLPVEDYALFAALEDVRFLYLAHRADEQVRWLCAQSFYNACVGARHEPNLLSQISPYLGYMERDFPDDETIVSLHTLVRAMF